MRILAGKGVGQVKTIIGNTATRLNLASDWGSANGSDATSVYAIEPATDDQPGQLQGGVNLASTGAAVPTGQTQVRLYNADTGGFVGKVTVGENLAGTVPAMNYTFSRWTADPAFPYAQNGLPPGDYLVLFRVINDGGLSPALCSEWNADVVGGPTTGSFAYANPITIAAGQQPEPAGLARPGRRVRVTQLT